jgi:DNA invertase Pin-like site-specific DNA recombinase
MEVPPAVPVAPTWLSTRRRSATHVSPARRASPKARPGGRKPDPLKQDAMAAMRRSGSTLQAIADQYGITKQAVDYLLAARET